MVQGSELPQKKRQEMASAIRTVGRVLGVELGLIPLDVALLRRKLEAASPEGHGVSQRRWANVRSLFGQALALGRPLQPARRFNPLSEGWQLLADRLPFGRRTRLLPVLRQLSEWQIEPGQLRLSDLERYREELLADRLRAGAEKAWDGIVWAWNASRREIADWPTIELIRETKRETYVLPWERFPISFKQDVDAYLRERAQPDLSGTGTHKPARPATLKTREYQLRAAASALVLTGVDANAIVSVAFLVSFSNYQQILRFYLDRNEGRSLAQAGHMAGFLKDVAIHWVKVDEETATKMRKVASNLAPKRPGMTAKNRKKLSVFDQQEHVEAYLSLPGTIQDKVIKDKRSSRVKAVLAQMAAAIALEQVSLIRRKNLASLCLDQHVIRRGPKLFLAIDEHETKNGDPIDLELPEATANIVDWYLREYRPHLIKEPTDALFPGEGGKPKNPGTLATQIKKTIHRYTGLDLNIHVLRHAGGKIFLDQKPGQYEVVRRVLGHRSMATTTRYYAGAEQRAAGAHFARVLEERRKSPATKIQAPDPIPHVKKRGGRS
jgi:integrase